jgi:hypothetical protein
MPVIQTAPQAAGGGGGDATAANQLTQISQVNDTLNTSVFIDQNGGSNFNDALKNSVFLNNALQSVFKDQFENSVFRDQSGLSVLRDSTDTSTFNTLNGNSILKQSKISNNLTSVISFQNTTPATIATDIQNWLQANNVVILQICYADAGGGAPNPHTALIIYNAV